ncbi:MAG: BadF/BadG/BcrA/BcrD ATPase family protein [Myxococcota bacterium]
MFRNKNKYLGIDVGAETIKLVVLNIEKNKLKWTDSTIIEHYNNPEKYLKKYLEQLKIDSFAGAACTGRMSKLLRFKQVPTPKAMVQGFHFLHPEQIPCTLVNIGAHGFSVLEIHDLEKTIYRQNDRCSQGTGNFLRQLVQRFDTTIEKSDLLARNIDNPAPLSGRCPVILKTDMTHLANKGIDKNRILAGLFDAVSENVEILIKPGISPENVYLIGGVSRSKRVKKHIHSFCEEKKMNFVDLNWEKDEFLFYEAIGAAFEAYSLNLTLPVEYKSSAVELIRKSSEKQFETIPPLKNYLDKIIRISPPKSKKNIEKSKKIIFGFDMGSTGSKALALDLENHEILWNGYVRTSGNPVEAAKNLLSNFFQNNHLNHEIVAFGTTGSGREIVGSMLKTCYGDKKIFILNEIAAHAKGALHYDPEVDTIFEIGGQDAKYIRLAEGEIYDSAMNEACSAGTGSFIEEQGSKFENVKDVVDLGKKGINASEGISLGQHCSVFMAEIIDQALSSGEQSKTVIAGIYDSIIKNYLNRVKGSRSVGNKIFCQGMPFSADALAAAVVRQTGREVIIPPDPGLTGALGICLLVDTNLNINQKKILDPEVFLASSIISKDTFTCKSNQGCGGSGNKCKIDRLKVKVLGKTKTFLWGGSCSLYEKSSSGIVNKLPDNAPDPFRERQQLMDKFIASVSKRNNNPVVGITDEFILKNMFPFFATYIKEIGFDLEIIHSAGKKFLKRGIEENNVPMCAPMSIYGGVLAGLIDKKPDHLFLPMIRDIERVENEPYSTICPLSQASSNIYYKTLKLKDKGVKFHTPVIDMGIDNYQSELFIKSINRLNKSFEISNPEVQEKAFNSALRAQHEFDKKLKLIGLRAINFAEKSNLPVIVVLGRSYTIHNKVLNSNVPSLLRELGTISIPVECYPVKKEEAPIYNDVYWGYSQTNLRAAHKIRKTSKHYSVFCSNYSCGPDSFNLHFYSYIMEGKPFGIIETDGHSGDAGTKTRLEAFLYCVDSDLKNGEKSRTRKQQQFKFIELDKPTLRDTNNNRDILLFPKMGENAPIISAVLRGDGFRAESLPMPDREDLNLGRKYSSGKECLPATVTLGSLLKRLKKAKPEERFSFFMPTANGPCRFGMYNNFHKIVIKKLGLSEQVNIVSQPDSDYFAGISKSLAIKALCSFIFGDILFDALLDSRPIEKIPGKADKIFKKWQKIAIKHLESTPAPNIGSSLLETMSNLFGLKSILENALKEFKKIKDENKNPPTVAIVGEIYVRLDPFSNDSIIRKLEKRGLKTKLAPFFEWMEYTDYINEIEIRKGRFPEVDSFISRSISTFIQNAVSTKFYKIAKNIMGWKNKTKPHHAVKSANKYINSNLVGEAILTLGVPVHEYKENLIEGVVSVGPLECMPNKVAQAQFFHVNQETGLPSLTVSLNGEPMSEEQLDNFVYEIKRKHYKKFNMKFPSSARINKVAKY